jgi:hypothetical protein
MRLMDAVLNRISFAKKRKKNGLGEVWLLQRQNSDAHLPVLDGKLLELNEEVQTFSSSSFASASGFCPRSTPCMYALTRSGLLVHGQIAVAPGDESSSWIWIDYQARTSHVQALLLSAQTYRLTIEILGDFIHIHTVLFHILPLYFWLVVCQRPLISCNCNVLFPSVQARVLNGCYCVLTTLQLLLLQSVPHTGQSLHWHTVKAMLTQRDAQKPHDPAQIQPRWRWHKQPKQLEKYIESEMLLGLV